MEVSRREIIDFLRKAGVEYCEDHSNQSEAYLRNRIRGELIPFLRRKFNPRIEENLARTADIIRRDDEWINGCVDAILSSGRIQKRRMRFLSPPNIFSRCTYLWATGFSKPFWKGLLRKAGVSPHPILNHLRTWR